MQKRLNNNAKKTHCIKGHPLIPGNIKKLSAEQSHRRVCLQCHRINGAKYRSKNKKPRIIPIQRFIKKIEITKNCWIWIGAKAGGKDGDYGIFRYESKQRYAHRFSYEHFKGPIPDGYQIDHLCRKRSCVNPNHLEIVTQRENLLRGEGASAKNSRKTHCKRDHEFTPENTYFLQGSRECRQCKRIRRQKTS